MGAAMKVAVTGTTGRVGQALAEAWEQAGHEVVRLRRADLDLGWPAPKLRAALAGIDFDLLANPAAVAAVEEAEADPEWARKVNANGPAALAAECAARGARLIHFSTDYVFGGYQPGLRLEDEATEPVNVYGQTKRLGEQLVLENHPAALVLRVSWVFGPEKPGFPERILNLWHRGEPLEAVADKWSRPTYSRDLATWVCRLAELPEARGVVHACQSGPPASWHSWATATLAIAAQLTASPPPPGVMARNAATHSGFQARRPVHTAMANGRLAAWLGTPPRPWEAALEDHLRGVLGIPADPPCQTI